MKRLVSACFLFLCVFSAKGQIGNEWIQYDQPYFKIPVGQDGLHKIAQATLQLTGLSPAADPRSFRIYHRGMEQAIFVSGESDGVFDPADYVEFYGKKNDGTLDSTLYEVPAYQPHGYYNLYSDTTAYFLTYGPGNGKRITSYSGSTPGLTEQAYHWAEKILVLKDDYSAGLDYGNVFKTAFDIGEGWTGIQILQGQEATYSIEGVTDTYTVSPKPTVQIQLTGRGPMFHDVELYVGARLLNTISFAGYESHLHEQELEWSDVDAAGKVAIRIRVTGANGSDRVSAGYIRFLFPQKITMAGVPERMFLLNVNPGNTSLLKITSPPAGLRLFDVTDPSSLVGLTGQLTTSLDVEIPSTATSRKILATTQALTVTKVRRINFREVDPSRNNYVIITHPSLRKPALGYLDPVKAFAEYRSLPEGGGFDTLILNIDQVYDQFNFGEPSPRAIFQFMKFCASVKLPSYLFLIGKGLDVNYGYRRNPSAFSLYRDLVPSAGYPGSDMAFSAGLGGIPNVPAVATGRLTANTAAEVAVYLNKVKEHDARPFDDLNRKKILHLSGGIEESEPVLFRDILKDYAQVAEDYYLGGHVQAIVKRSTEIKLINIADQVNKGLGLITFFGHSAPNTLDFDIGLVSDPVMGYKNAGKYPFLLMNGCDAGSFFLNTNILGENWIKTPDKGAVGFIAHSSYGLLTGLQRYSSIFYDVAFADSSFIKRGVGMVQQEVARRYLAEPGPSALAISQVQQMVLLGDPALRIFGADKPDYSPDPMISVESFDDESISALGDSFRIQIPVRNFGVARQGNFRIAVTRRFNGDQTIVYDTIVPGVLFADTIAMTIRNPSRSGYGINVFTIEVDADNIVEELDETNNAVSFEYFIPLSGTRNLYPYNFSIVNEQEIKVSFQNTDLLGEAREYLVEIDTTDSFSSGFKKQFTVSAQVLGTMDVTLLDQDSLVYYWRTKISQPMENESKNWTLSSFTYINDGDEGWAQIDFPQYESNPTNGLVTDPQIRRMQFQETVSDIAIRTFSASAGYPPDSVSFKVNGVEFNLLYEGGACRENTINLMAFDRRSTQPYAGIYFKWYELLYEYGGRKLLCGREPYVINSFTPNELVTGNNDDLIQYIDNIAQGDSVVLFNIGNAGYELWPQAAISKLGEVGISPLQLANVYNGDAVVIFGRKGSSPGTAQIFHGSSGQNSVDLSKTIAGRYTSATMATGTIGPAQRWDRFIPRLKEVEPNDEFSFDIIGIRQDGQQDTLATNVISEKDLSTISADEYPRLIVVYETSDDINLTATQLSKWLVLYEPVAEGLVFYRGSLEAQDVDEGESTARDFGFINIGNKEFPDSLRVEFGLRNTTNPASLPSAMKITAPMPGDTTLFTVPLKTQSLSGLYDVHVFVNPRITPEKNFDNNLIVLPENVNVLTDEMHPVIDVTFDGRYIHNDDYVSINPSVVIRLWDENHFMRKTDTLGVRIFLSYPCDLEPCALVPVYFSSDNVSWSAATVSSEFQVDFSPTDLLDGQYTLLVEAHDGSGNNSGETPYEISFRVKREETIEVTHPYPNPFMLETNFDVTLTGDDEMRWAYRFYVMTVNGKVVADFSTSAGGLHVGTNNIHWQGSGNDGQPLPNGIYFYRMLIRNGGDEREYVGKIVILR
jgi:hypothetical protein